MNICPIIDYSKKIPSTIKPIAKNALGGWRLFTEPMTDSYCFTQTDKTIIPSFLKRLLNIDEENIGDIQKITKMKDMILKIMGYEHPEELKFMFVGKRNTPASYEPVLGKILFSEGEYSDKDVIEILRHELEHLHQFVRIYKVKGEQAFLDGMLYIFKKNHPNATESDILNLKADFNNDFYKIMQEDASIEDFDAEKYYKAMCEYINFDYVPSKAYQYFNNLLEKDAYDVERKLLKALGKPAVLSVDQFPKNYKTMVELMNKKGIPSQYQDNLLLVLHIAACLKSIETPENFKRYLKIWFDRDNHGKVSPEDMDWFNKIANKLEKVMRCKVTQKLITADQKEYQQVEEWMRNDKFDIISISKDM